jgi:hypothetical protein
MRLAAQVAGCFEVLPLEEVQRTRAMLSPAAGGLSTEVCCVLDWDGRWKRLLAITGTVSFASRL